MSRGPVGVISWPWNPGPPGCGASTDRQAGLGYFSPGSRLLGVNLELGENLWGDGSLLLGCPSVCPSPHSHLQRQASQAYCIFFVPTKQQAVQSLPLWRFKPESRTLHFCPHHGARWGFDNILACPPSPLAEPTSADATGHVAVRVSGATRVARALDHCFQCSGPQHERPRRA